MTRFEESERENRELRERLSRLSQASVRINESLDFENVMQGVLDSARSLTSAKYGLMAIFDQSGRVQECFVSGLTAYQSKRLWALSEREVLFDYFANISEPLRVRDIHSYIRSKGLPEFRPQMPVSPCLAVLAAPIRHGGESGGTFYLTEKEGGGEFSAEDQETLMMFASQAALVITNARRFREEQRARADLEALIDTSPVGVAVFEAKTARLVTFNREVERILEDLRLPDGPVEKALEVLTVRRADGREVSLQNRSLADAFSAGETVRGEEVVFHVPDGRSVTALLNATPIHSEGGVIESFVVTMQDMTHLDELERLRAEFLAMVSHELRAPLAAVMGSAKSGLTDTTTLGTAEIVQLFRIIADQSDRMYGLINDLLDVARIATGTVQINPERTSITDVVDQARNTFHNGGGQNEIIMELGTDLPPILVDGRRIVQVLENLISNAARNAPATSPIRVTATRDDMHVSVSVSDKGRGISADRLPYLFRKFPMRDADKDARGDAGAGWGLAICKGIVEAHGGRIHAESEGIGRGAKFTFNVPIAEEDEAGRVRTSEPVAANARQEEDARESTPILIVDDDPKTLRSVRQALSRVGYTPLVTGNPEHVHGLMERYRPHLILMDLVLPETDGVELMGRILKDVDVPIIFISAYGHDEAVARALDAGADDYIVKPFSPMELTARIRAALRKRTAVDRVQPTRPFAFGDLNIDYVSRQVTVRGRWVRVTEIEYQLLAELSVNAGRILTYQHLLKTVWSMRNFDDTQVLRTTVKNLRRKLGDDANDPAYIFNEFGVGYRLGEAGQAGH